MRPIAYTTYTLIIETRAGKTQEPVTRLTAAGLVSGVKCSRVYKSPRDRIWQRWYALGQGTGLLVERFRGYAPQA